ncbi:MAG: FAD-binding protein [Solirubrobacterales bacterium]|nr:FAD-binding protein [Solirubrobacterales bacterium]
MGNELIDEAAVGRLADHLDGEVIGPHGAGYDEARKVFNGMIDRRPALIARCASTDDVVAAVDCARQNGLPVAVRCGGHSVVGMSVCDDGMLIDLAGVSEVDVDPEARVARTGGGVLWGEFDAATQPHGLHTPGGRVTTTGVGGFTTGGGYGWTSSMHGLTSDNLLSAEVVTADGRVLTASEDENEDLFWGIRGGGGNFGVVTRFDFELHELGPIVLAGEALWPIERAPEVVRAWRDYVERAPDELSTGCAVVIAPPEDFVPEHLHGRPALAIVGMYVGDPEAGAAVVQPLKELAPDLDLFQPMPYTDFQALLDPANPPGLRNYFRGDYLDGLSDAAIDVYLERATETVSSTTPLAQIVIFRLGAGVTSVADEATAFSHRDAAYLFHPILLWEDPAEDERQTASGRGLGEAMQPFGTGASYLNFTPDRDRVRDAFGTEKYRRLVALKDRYDPENLFRVNQNIVPAG